ncbi:hypothetical protein FSP39_021179 [Pinctada imbricata]|uniref:Uncharacterized protein n=1 Tax=Pinctada imbricata TaxID=66713 RepID=A0AA89BJP6_PINIB|nr:hypothetical protein FSP39_021179 [Pinctada imbricata]
MWLPEEKLKKGGDLNQHLVAAPTAKHPIQKQSADTHKCDAKRIRNTNAQHRNIKLKGPHINQRNQCVTGADFGRSSATQTADGIIIQNTGAQPYQFSDYPEISKSAQLIRYDSEKRVVSKLMQIPICCKGWREFNETTCKKAQASRGYPFQDTKIAKNFLRSKRTKRSRLSELDEECEGGSCSYEEAEELELNRVEICGYFKRWKCNRQNCQIGRYCDTLRDNGCEDLSQYVVTCKVCTGETFGPGCSLNCSCDDDEYCDPIQGDCYRDRRLASSLHRDDLAEDTYDMMDRNNYDAKHRNRNNDVNGVSAGIEDTYSHMTSESHYGTTSRRLTENDNSDYSVTASYSQDMYGNTDTSQYYDTVQGRQTPFRAESEYSWEGVIH